MDVDFPYLSPEVNRHGKKTLYVRRNGRRVRIREKQGMPEFAAAYAAAVERLAGPMPVKAAPTRKPLAWLSPASHMRSPTRWNPNME